MSGDPFDRDPGLSERDAAVVGRSLARFENRQAERREAALDAVGKNGVHETTTAEHDRREPFACRGRERPLRERLGEGGVKEGRAEPGIAQIRKPFGKRQQVEGAVGA